MSTQARALIAMSGGVDSSVAAYLMQQAGYRCMGATMRLFEAEQEQPESTCCSLEQVEDARAVAHRLGIPYYVFNFKDDFRRHVMDAFVRDYESGLTPNPCVACNRHLKFDRLLRRALELECQYVVTGHYARITRQPDGRYLLCKAVDTARDQTYFLYSLTQEQLSHVLFPLGELTKPEVREIARAQGFVNARKRDSQDICFVPDGDYPAFLERYTGRHRQSGDFLDLQGNVIGRHRGAVAYTIGQRKGLALSVGHPVYVCGKDMAANTVTIGENSDLMRTALLADDWVFSALDAPREPLRCHAKARSRMTEQPATVYPAENGVFRVEFDTPQRALTPGQAIVLYDGDVVLGGGTIRQIL